MSDRLKRISYSIHLDPLNNPADLYASKVLHQLADKQKKLCSDSIEDSGLALHEAKNVHKNIYLSGLFLHLLNPELSQHLSAQLTEQQITGFTLEKTLQGLGYNLSNQDLESHDALNAERFETLATTICNRVAKEAALTREHVASIPESSTKGNVDNISNIDSDIIMATKGQNDHLIDMVNAQAKELTELKKMASDQHQLISSLTKSISSGQTQNLKKTVEEESFPVIDLNERLAHVQRVKKKGLF
ncbi:hypothetical protein L4D20_10025 [Vibrio kyushuensis]|uniref:hypothetical protein n=1 Tax=Vibrio kyushuensis TaxID=2910249 RepID=UPI003D1278BE